MGCINTFAMLDLALLNGVIGLGRYLLIRIMPTFLNSDISSSVLLKEYLNLFIRSIGWTQYGIRLKNSQMIHYISCSNYIPRELSD